MTRRYLPRESGFTLIEILVVISVIGILVAVLTVAVQGVRLRAFDEKTVALLRRLETGCQTYVSRYNAVPPAAPGGAPADPGDRFGTSGGTNYANSRALHYWLGSQLKVASSFNSAGVAQIVKTMEPIMEFKKSEASTWDLTPPATYAAQRFDANGIVAYLGAPQGGFVLDSWGRAIAYVQANPVTAGDMSSTTFPRPGSSFGKAGRNLVGFVQFWSRGSNGVSTLPGPAGMAPNAAGGNGDIDDICLWFLPYY